jgi:cytochrome c oxidase assembly protein subunit 15
LHRLLGRLIGVVFALPWLYFTLTGALKGMWRARAFVALLLGGSQGLMGWYMVKSGLVDRPEVSHFRLAAHLSLAFLCGMWVLSMLIDLTRTRRGDERADEAERPMLPEGLSRALPKALWWSFPPLLVLQIVYGAFMAGKKAGYLYSTFPDMNGYLIGPTVGTSASLIDDLLSNPDTIHTLHRLLAWVALIIGGLISHRVARTVTSLKPQARLFGGALALQFTLGALTVTSGMNHALAVAHQGVAFLLLSATLWLYQSALRARAHAHH